MSSIPSMSHKEQRSRKMSWACASALVAALAVSCGFDRGDRWLPDEGRGGQPACELDAQRCGDGIERCVTTTEGVGWVTIEDCDAQGKVCAPSLLKCTDCVPDAVECDEQTPRTCSSDGSGFVSSGSACDTQPGVACRSGTCTDLCASAAERRSNVGCEYWAVDLDNAMIDDSLNAAAQQFAVVVSNPQPDLSATVTIEQDDSAVGAAGAPTQVASAEVPPLGLRVFKLGPREVDGSPEGEYNTGSHTALTRQAYRVTSTVPIIAYQFNPLENVNVFSNDASLLKPVEALTYDPGTLSNAYVVLGWPQTIASTDDPATNFNPNNPIDLRSFVTIVATREATSIRVRPTARIIGSDSVPSIDAGGELAIKLEPFEVLNLETDDFNADFTGSAIDADQPIVVFSGGEASDAPFFDSLSGRQCCADHLEEQLDPRRTAGRRFVATVSANRTRALSEAGASIATVTQTDHFRVIAATERGANITTTLNGAFTELSLAGLGSFVDIDATRDFVLESDEPIQQARTPLAWRVACRAGIRAF